MKKSGLLSLQAAEDNQFFKIRQVNTIKSTKARSVLKKRQEKLLMPLLSPKFENKLYDLNVDKIQSFNHGAGYRFQSKTVTNHSRAKSVCGTNTLTSPSNHVPMRVGSLIQKHQAISRISDLSYNRSKNQTKKHKNANFDLRVNNLTTQSPKIPMDLSKSSENNRQSPSSNEREKRSNSGNKSQLNMIQKLQVQKAGTSQNSKRPKTSIQKRDFKLLPTDKYFDSENHVNSRYRAFNCNLGATSSKISISNNNSKMQTNITPSERTFTQYQSSQTKLRSRIVKIAGKIKSNQRSSSMLRDRPEETISFNEKMDSIKSDDANTRKELSNERKQQMNIEAKSRHPNSQLIDQINSYIAKDPLDSQISQCQQPQDDVKSPSSLTEVRKKPNKRGIFDSKKSIDIKSKPRIVDTTLTAYKLLERGFINQPGNPNSLEQHFIAKSVNKKDVYKEMFGHNQNSNKRKSPKISKQRLSKMKLKPDQINYSKGIKQTQLKPDDEAQLNVINQDQIKDIQRDGSVQEQIPELDQVMRNKSQENTPLNEFQGSHPSKFDDLTFENQPNKKQNLNLEKWSTVEPKSKDTPSAFGTQNQGLAPRINQQVSQAPAHEEQKQSPANSSGLASFNHTRANSQQRKVRIRRNSNRSNSRAERRVQSQQSQRRRRIQVSEDDREQMFRDRDMNERIYEMLERVTMQREQQIHFDQMRRQSQVQNGGVPAFSGNHIQNLTINAQPGFDIGQLAQLDDGQQRNQNQEERKLQFEAPETVSAIFPKDPLNVDASQNQSEKQIEPNHGESPQGIQVQQLNQNSEIDNTIVSKVGSDDLDIFSMDFKSDKQSLKIPIKKDRKNSMRCDQIPVNLFKIQEKTKGTDKKRKNFKKMSTLPECRNITMSSGTYPNKKVEIDEQISEFSAPVSKKSNSSGSRASNIFRSSRSKPKKNHVDSSSGNSHLMPPKPKNKKILKKMQKNVSINSSNMSSSNQSSRSRQKNQTSHSKIPIRQNLTLPKPDIPLKKPMIQDFDEQSVNSQSSFTSSSFSKFSNRPQVLVDKLSNQQALKKNPTLRKQKTTIYEEKNQATDTLMIRPKYLEKIDQSSQKIRIDGSLKISQNLSNSQRRGDLVNQTPQIGESSENLVQVLRDKIMQMSATDQEKDWKLMMKKIIDDMSENEVKAISTVKRRKKSSAEEEKIQSSEASPNSGPFDKYFNNPIMTPDPNTTIQETQLKNAYRNTRLDPKLKDWKVDPKYKISKGSKLNDSQAQSSLFRDNNVTTITKEASKFTKSMTTSKKSDNSHSNNEFLNIGLSQLPLSHLSQGLSPDSEVHLRLKTVDEKYKNQDLKSIKILSKKDNRSSSSDLTLNDHPIHFIPEASESSSQMSQVQISVIEDPMIDIKKQKFEKKRSLDETKLSKIEELNYHQEDSSKQKESQNQSQRFRMLEEKSSNSKIVFKIEGTSPHVQKESGGKSSHSKTKVAQNQDDMKLPSFSDSQKSSHSQQVQVKEIIEIPQAPLKSLLTQEKYFDEEIKAKERLMKEQQNSSFSSLVEKDDQNEIDNKLKSSNVSESSLRGFDEEAKNLESLQKVEEGQEKIQASRLLNLQTVQQAPEQVSCKIQLGSDIDRESSQPEQPITFDDQVSKQPEKNEEPIQKKIAESIVRKDPLTLQTHTRIARDDHKFLRIITQKQAQTVEIAKDDKKSISSPSIVDSKQSLKQESGNFKVRKFIAGRPGVKELPIQKFINRISNFDIEIQPFKKQPKLDIKVSQFYFDSMSSFQELPLGQRMKSSHFTCDRGSKEEAASFTIPSPVKGEFNVDGAQKGLKALSKGSLRDMMLKNIKSGVQIQIKINKEVEEQKEQDEKDFIESIQKRLQVKKDEFDDFTHEKQFDGSPQEMLSPQEMKMKNEVQKINFALETDLMIKTKKSMFKFKYKNGNQSALINKHYRKYLELIEQIDTHNNERLKAQIDQENEYANKLQLHDHHLVSLLKNVKWRRMTGLPQQQIHFITKSAQGELKKMLIEYHDINFSKIIYPKMRIRFRNNKEWIENNIKLEKKEALELKRIRSKLSYWIPHFHDYQKKSNTLEVNLNGLCGHEEYTHMFKQLKDLYEIKNLFVLKKDSIEDSYEEDIKLKPSFQNEKVNSYKRSRSLKVMQRERRRKDEEFIADQNKFVDLVWLDSDKNQQVAIVKLFNTKVLDNSQIDTLCFYTFKQNLVKKGLLEELDYQQVEIHQIKFSKKCLPGFVKVAMDWFKINQVLNKNFNVKFDIYHIEFLNNNGSRIVNFKNLMVPHVKIIKIIAEQQQVVPQIAKIKYEKIKEVTPVLPKDFINFINEHDMNERFDSLLTQFNFRQNHDVIESNHNSLALNLENTKSPTQFCSYIAFHSIKRTQNSNEELFLHNQNSIFQNMFDIEQDYEMYDIIKQLNQSQKNQFLIKYNGLKKIKYQDLTESQRHNLQNMEMTYENFTKDQTCNYQWHDINESDFDDSGESNFHTPTKVTEKSTSNNFMSSYKGSVNVDEIERQVKRHTSLKDQKKKFRKNVDYFRRADALNKFQLSTCEFHILSNIDKHENRIKDDVNIFYKRIEKQILDKDDEFWMKIKYRRKSQTLNAIAREINNSEESEAPSDEPEKPLVIDQTDYLHFKHGYKSTFMRDESGKYLFEIYIPIEEKKGQKKLEEHQSLIRKPKNYKEFKELEDIDAKKKEEEKAQPKRSKIFQQTLVDDFETDESMKLLGKSDLGMNSDDCPDVDDLSMSDTTSPDKSRNTQTTKRSFKNAKIEKKKKESFKIKKINQKSKLGLKSSKLAHVFDSSKDNVTPLAHYNNLKKQRDIDDKGGISFLNAGMSNDAKSLLDKMALLEEKGLYEIVNQQDQVNKEQGTQIWKNLKDKVKIDGLISQVELNVHVDNQRQLQKLVLQKDQEYNKLLKQKSFKKVNPMLDNLRDKINKSVIPLDTFQPQQNMPQTEPKPQLNNLDVSPKANPTPKFNGRAEGQSVFQKKLSQDPLSMSGSKASSSLSNESPKNSIKIRGSDNALLSISKQRSAEKQDMLGQVNLQFRKNSESQLIMNAIKKDTLSKVEKQIQLIKANQKMFKTNIVSPLVSQKSLKEPSIRFGNNIQFVKKNTLSLDSEFSSEMRGNSFSPVQPILNLSNQNSPLFKLTPQTKPKRLNSKNNVLQLNVDIISDTKSDGEIKNEQLQNTNNKEMITKLKKKMLNLQQFKNSKTTSNKQIDTISNLNSNSPYKVGTEQIQSTDKLQLNQKINSDVKKRSVSQNMFDGLNLKIIQSEVKTAKPALRKTNTNSSLGIINEQFRQIFKNKVVSEIDKKKSKIDGIFKKAYKYDIGRKLIRGIDNQFNTNNSAGNSPSGHNTNDMLNKFLNPNAIHDQESDFCLENELENVEKIRMQKQEFKKIQELKLKKRELILSEFKIRRNSSQMLQPQSGPKITNSDHFDVLSQVSKHFEDRQKLILANDKKNYEILKIEAKESKLLPKNSEFRQKFRAKILRKLKSNLKKQDKRNKFALMGKSFTSFGSGQNIEKVTQPMRHLSFSSLVDKLDVDSTLAFQNNTPQQVKKDLQIRNFNDELQTRKIQKQVHIDTEIQMTMLINRMEKAIETKNTTLMIDILTRYQGDIEAIRDEDGNSLLIMASNKGDFAMCDLLLQRGLNVNGQNNLGNTALHYAIMNKFIKTIDLLILYGVDETLENKMGQQPWQML